MSLGASIAIKQVMEELLGKLHGIGTMQPEPTLTEALVMLESWAEDLRRSADAGYE